MKRRELIRAIRKAANRQGVELLEGEGGKHSALRLEGKLIPIPRHSEINEITAREILKQCEEKLGQGWWKR